MIDDPEIEQRFRRLEAAYLSLLERTEKVERRQDILAWKEAGLPVPRRRSKPSEKRADRA